MLQGWGPVRRMVLGVRQGCLLQRCGDVREALLGPVRLVVVGSVKGGKGREMGGVWE